MYTTMVFFCKANHANWAVAPPLHAPGVFTRPSVFTKVSFQLQTALSPTSEAGQNSKPSPAPVLMPTSSRRPLCVTSSTISSAKKPICSPHFFLA